MNFSRYYSETFDPNIIIFKIFLCYQRGKKTVEGAPDTIPKCFVFHWYKTCFLKHYINLFIPILSYNVKYHSFTSQFIIRIYKFSDFIMLCTTFETKQNPEKLMYFIIEFSGAIWDAFPQVLCYFIYFDCFLSILLHNRRYLSVS